MPGISLITPMKPLFLAALAGLFFVPSLVKAQFQQVFMIGADNAATTEFEQESGNLPDYYWENGNYLSWGGQIWTTNMEPWNSGVATDTIGFPRALLHPGTANTQTNIYFNLDPNEAGPNQPLRLTLDLFALKANTTHDLDVRLNGTVASPSTPF